MNGQPSIVLAIRSGDAWQVYPCGPVGPPMRRPHPLPTAIRYPSPGGPVTDVLPRVPAGPRPVEVTALLPKLSPRPLPPAPHAAAARAPHPAVPPVSPVQAVSAAAPWTPAPTSGSAPNTTGTGKHRRPAQRWARWRRTPATDPA